MPFNSVWFLSSVLEWYFERILNFLEKSIYLVVISLQLFKKNINSFILFSKEIQKETIFLSSSFFFLSRYCSPVDCGYKLPSSERKHNSRWYKFAIKERQNQNRVKPGPKPQFCCLWNIGSDIPQEEVWNL